jgi:spore coat polysaccharide biosynthesis protein SpsF
VTFATEQEDFWAGKFGTDYIRRNLGDALLASNVAFFARALRCAHRVDDCIEFGANIGLNLRALKLLYPAQAQYAVEINADAVAELRKFLPAEHVAHSSVIGYRPPKGFALAFVKGVLIHINPDALPQVYDTLHDATARYLLVCEYYAPSPVSIPYRGHSDRLFKRDFCGEILDRHKDFELIDYGFCYRRDPAFPQDDVTWFLMQRRE